MTRLMSRLDDDSGAISILVTFLIASGVVIGLLAMVVDIGRLFNERRVLANGADAAALAVARECAIDDEQCETSAPSIASSLADANAGPDEVSRLDELCGSGDLGACRALGSHAWECQTADNYPNYARVRTSTEESDGGTLVPSVFAQAFGFDGQGMWACSQAIWGTARGAIVTFPLALSACDYVSETSAIIEIFKPPSFKPGRGPTCTVIDNDGNEQVLQDMVNGFFYVQLDDTRRDCLTPVPVNIGDVLPRSDNIVQLCGPDYEDAFQSYIGVETPLPVFDALPSGGGIGGTTMRVASFVAFTLRGYRLGGRRTFGGPPGGWPSECRANNRCFYGDFGTAVSGGTGVDPDAPNLGLQSVQLIP
jgi:Flp pilus assembly protein TadG